MTMESIFYSAISKQDHQLRGGELLTKKRAIRKKVVTTDLDKT